MREEKRREEKRREEKRRQQFFKSRGICTRSSPKGIALVLLSAGIVTFLSYETPTQKATAQQQGQWFAPTSCGGAGCFKVPTSLVPVDPGDADPDGWEHNGGNCGIERCWWIFYTPCGPPLASGACL